MPLSLAELVTKQVMVEVSCFEREGYLIINCIDWRSLIHRYMTHKTNGNRIDIFGYPETGDIMIHKNRKKIKSYQVKCK